MLINDLVVALCAVLHQHFGAFLGDQTKEQRSQPEWYDVAVYGLVAVPCACWALSQCARLKSSTMISGATDMGSGPPPRPQTLRPTSFYFIVFSRRGKVAKI